ncbi:TlpA disulfide reductase family protein [Aurantibacter sp.]|uniref:TlpA family protein disulfide reductase n=1 Tax=Aurantibacter sp. TaxID=2807103 RepID=UPI003267AE41
MNKKHLSFSNIIFALFIVALIIPKTRIALQVAINKAKVFVMSPSKLKEEEQTQLQSFQYQLTSLEGNQSEINVGQGEVTFISYWATWCPPCIAEMPGIVKLYEDYGSKINFLLLTNENSEKVKAFLRKKGYDLPVYNPNMPSPELLQSHNIPTNYIIDKTGKIIIKEVGAVDWNSNKIREIIDNAL